MHSELNVRFPLLPGSHPSRDDGMCAMEMVSWLAGEEHSDGPRCTCPVIASFVRAFNDLLPTPELRERHLRRLLPQLINTVGTPAQERTRAWLAADAAMRVFAPMALEREGDVELAATLRAMPRIRGQASARAAAAALPPGAPRPVSWIVARAADGSPPVTWVSAAVHAARAAGTEAAWSAAAKLVAAMAAVGRAAARTRIRA